MLHRVIFLLIILTIIWSCKKYPRGTLNEFKSSKLMMDSTFTTKGPIHSLNVDFISEASGIAASRNHIGWFYVHNDSGNPAELFIIDSVGKYVGKINPNGIQNRDWEDIAIGPGPDSLKNYIYIGDSGDNNERRKKYFIYRIEEPKFSDTIIYPFIINLEADRISFEYPLRKSNNCEALMIDPITKDLILATKSYESGIYRIKYPYSITTTNPAELIISVPIEKLTAGDFSSDGSELLIKDYRQIYHWNRNLNISVDSMLKTKPNKYPYLIEQQGEGLCWAVNGKSYFTLSELENGKKQYLIRYDKK
ncbi:MAG TPA: hypothetical protein VK590_04190 [Saprospiraceae bacterium]|nr:hypothetical protein [Saprospiraceae bacterium]